MNDFDNKKTFALFKSAINRQLITELEAGKSKIYKFPQADMKKTALEKKSLSYLQNINSFDCVILTDVLSVRYFLQIFEVNEIDLFILDDVRILTFGEAVSDELRLSQIHADIIPTSNDLPTIISSMKNYFGEADFQNLKILTAHEKNRKPEIADLLIEENLEIITMPVYEIVSGKTELLKLKIILESGGIDEFIITQPIDLISLGFYFDNLPFEEILRETRVLAKGELISKFLAENKIKHQMWNGKLK